MKNQAKYTYASWNEAIPKERAIVTEKHIEKTAYEDTDKSMIKDPQSVCFYILLLILILLCAIALIPAIENLIKITGLIIILVALSSFSNARQERKRRKRRNDELWWE